MIKGSFIQQRPGGISHSISLDLQYAMQQTAPCRETSCPKLDNRQQKLLATASSLHLCSICMGRAQGTLVIKGLERGRLQLRSRVKVAGTETKSNLHAVPTWPLTLSSSWFHSEELFGVQNVHILIDFLRTTRSTEVQAVSQPFWRFLDMAATMMLPQLNWQDQHYDKMDQNGTCSAIKRAGCCCNLWFMSWNNFTISPAACACGMNGNQQSSISLRHLFCQQWVIHVIPGWRFQHYPQHPIIPTGSNWSDSEANILMCHQSTIPSH